MDKTESFIYAQNKDDAVELIRRATVVFVLPRFGLKEEYVKIAKVEAVRLVELAWDDTVSGATFARLSKKQGYLFLG